MITRVLSTVAALFLFACSSAPPNKPAAPCPAAPSTKVPVCYKPWTEKPPGPIDKVKDATLPVRFGSKAFSAIRVAEDLLLSAAHCVVGLAADEKRGPFHINVGGKKVEVKVAEMGDYKAKRDHMADWAVFRVDDPSVLAGIAIAEFPDRKKMDAYVSQRAPSIRACGLPVWTIGYPGPSFRRYPRTPIPGRLQRFLSRGFLQSHDAYRELNALTWETNLLYDQQSGTPLPADLKIDVEKTWSAHAKHPVVQVYEDYFNGGDPLIYHSADFSPGSSGGGLFEEQNGELLGVIPFGVSIVPNPFGAWIGFFQAYRIDLICQESKVLSALDKCKRLAPAAP